MRLKELEDRRKQMSSNIEVMTDKLVKYRDYMMVKAKEDAEIAERKRQEEEVIRLA